MILNLINTLTKVSKQYLVVQFILMIPNQSCNTVSRCGLVTSLSCPLFVHCDSALIKLTFPQTISNLCTWAQITNFFLCVSVNQCGKGVSLTCRVAMLSDKQTVTRFRIIMFSRVGVGLRLRLTIDMNLVVLKLSKCMYKSSSFYY